MQGISRDTDIENRPMDMVGEAGGRAQVGEGLGEMNGENSIGAYTLSYVK